MNHRMKTAITAAAMAAAVTLGATSMAYGATVAAPGVSAPGTNAHSTIVRPSSAASGASVIKPDEIIIVGWGPYEENEQCAATGAAMYGRSVDDGVVVGYVCEYNGLKLPLGPWQLLLQVGTCGGGEVAEAAPAGSCPSATARLGLLGLAA